jgi:putative ABC transport system ATP-binding protein
MSEPDHPQPAAALTDVRLIFGGGRITALDGISVSIERGQVVVVRGPSGAGKSTLLHVLAGLVRPSSGTVRIGGTDLAGARHLSAVRQRIGLVFQLHNLLPQLSAQENVEVPLIGTGTARRERRRRSTAALEEFGLVDQAGREPTRLSGGERQRVAIARALAGDPLLLLADEPTSNLDDGSTRAFIHSVLARTGQGVMAAIIVTHDPRLDLAADRVVVMAAGRVVDEAPGRPEGTNDGPARAHLP